MTENGKLSEAQKLLLQKFPHLPQDDPLVELAAWNAALEEKLENFEGHLNAWTTAILAQTKLSQEQNQLITSLGISLQNQAQNSDQLGKALLQLKVEFTALKSEFATLTNSIDSQMSPSCDLKDSISSLHFNLGIPPFQSLWSAVQKLDEKINRIEALINGESQGSISDWEKAEIEDSAQEKIAALSGRQAGAMLLMVVLLIISVGQGIVVFQLKNELASTNAALSQVKRSQGK